jgi:acyl-CoA reductase-like NAD-dependent aldehyde dehydrogenase
MSEIAKHWIDGEWTGSGTVSESVNPATGAVLGRWATVVHAIPPFQV